MMKYNIIKESLVTEISNNSNQIVSSILKSINNTKKTPIKNNKIIEKAAKRIIKRSIKYHINKILKNKKNLVNQKNKIQKQMINNDLMNI